jgi:uroporphyrinogen III methyltransferase/synthase
MSSPKPSLTGRTILLTRQRDDRDELAAALESEGARLISCPTIAITDPESYDRLDAAIVDLFGYDWVIFTSVNGVEYFLRRMEVLGQSLEQLDELRVCAIGEATAERLANSAVHVDLVPTDSNAEGVYRALCDYLGGAEGLRTLNMLLPRAAVARDVLPKALLAAGARVDDVPAYRTIAATGADLGRLKALLDGGGVDCVTFTSSSTVRNFAGLFEVDELGTLLAGVDVACIGAVTAATAREFGLTVAVQPPDTTFSALAAAIRQFYSSQS